MSDDVVLNPDVRPSHFWEWSGFWSLIIALLEWGNTQVAVWKDPPQWALYALIGLPVAIRWAKGRLGGLPTSFRRDAAATPQEPPGA